MIQGFDPRTGEPVGEPVAETAVMGGGGSGLELGGRKGSGGSESELIGLEDEGGRRA